MVEASSPVRICDLGGWTDTWFGGPGRVLNLAVTPGVEVRITTRSGGGGRVFLQVASSGERYQVTPGESRDRRHPLIEAAIDAVPPPVGFDLDMSVGAGVPPGSGCGTSAAVAVAVLGALLEVSGSHWEPFDVARMAHRLETVVLGGESGVQDQVSSAFGGINYLEIDPFPEATVTTLEPWPDLEARLSLVFVGRSHDSSAIHRHVIDHPTPQRAEALDTLRTAAVAARDSVSTRDMAGFAAAMILNTGGQIALHPDLVGGDARRVIEAARRNGAAGWKVNGAGGDGGSVTLLSPTVAIKARVDRAVAAERADDKVSAVRISQVGLEVTVHR